MNNIGPKSLEMGGALVLLLKGLGAIALIMLAVIDRNLAFIKKKDTKPGDQVGILIGEAALVGFMSMISFAFLFWNRGFLQRLMTRAGLKTLGFAFAIFFAFHWLLELTGMNEIEETTATRKLGAFESRAKKSILVKVLLALTFFVFVVFTFCGWDSPLGIASTWKTALKGSPYVAVFLEGLIFSIMNAIPFILIVKDRGGKTREAFVEFLRYVIVFFMFYFPMQYGGLYREVGLMPKAAMPAQAPAGH